MYVTDVTMCAAFKDTSAAFAAKGYTIYGMSADQPDVQAGWKKEHSLNYTLLCDPSKQVRPTSGVQAYTLAPFAAQTSQ